MFYIEQVPGSINQGCKLCFTKSAKYKFFTSHLLRANILNGKARGTISLCITRVFNDHFHEGDLFCVHSLIFKYKEREEQNKKKIILI